MKPSYEFLVLFSINKKKCDKLSTHTIVTTVNINQMHRGFSNSGFQQE